MVAKFNEINWKTAEKELFENQTLLLKAYINNDKIRLLNIQNKIVRSFSARAIAVKKITANNGKNTPGIDGKICNTHKLKFELIKNLKNLKNYKAKPVKKVPIPKANGKTRFLGIPTVFDRAVQTLYLFTIQPIVEELNCQRSYGFVNGKSLHDAATYIWLNLASKHNKRRYILNCDIKQFFSSVNHDWLIKNIPINKYVLNQFLKSGFMQAKIFKFTNTGFPEGSPIGPALANLVLAGLEKYLQDFPIRIIRYADDFVILGPDIKTLLKCKTKVNEFLKIRGLSLNSQKTKINSIENGFKFVGLFFREYQNIFRSKGKKKKGIFLIKPVKKKIFEFIKSLKAIIYKNKNSKSLIPMLIKINQKLRGFGNHYRHYTVTKIFNLIAYKIFHHIFKMLSKKHKKWGKRKIFKFYFKKVGNMNGIFTLQDNKTKIQYHLFILQSIKIVRHKLVSFKNYFDPSNFEKINKLNKQHAKKTILSSTTKTALLRKQLGICPICNTWLLNEENLEIHHKNRQIFKGVHKYKNLVLLHKTCHKQLHNAGSKLIAEFKNRGLI